MSAQEEKRKKLRRIEIKTRKLSNQIFSGSYHSAFKGRGISFSEVREYNYGDDIRAIDWNVTARHNKAFIKVFEEERELTLELEQLKQEHRDLDSAIDALLATTGHDRIQVQRLKKRKLQLRDRIGAIEDELFPDIIA